MEIDHLHTWVGRKEVRNEIVTFNQAAQLAALFDWPAPPQKGDILPYLWHWANVFPPRRQSELGPDGHPTRGGFLPPVQLPRRMWAGGHLTFSHPIHVEEPLRRTSTIANVTPKSGGSGPLIFVRIDHEIAGRDGTAIREQQDIVYRDHPLRGQPPAKGGRAPKYDHRVEWRPDPIAMFRYSAITFNAHRIHYDRDYAVGVEGYRGLVVPGPMIATALLDALVRHVPESVTSFNYRSVSPLFDGDTVHLCAKAANAEGRFELWALDRDGSVAMQAEAQVRAGPEHLD